MDTFTRLFFASNDDNPTGRMKDAFVAVLRGSTWYACEEVSRPFAEEELSQLVSGMIDYVKTRADILYRNEERLYPEAIRCRIGIFDLARKYSSDFISESAYAIPEDRSLDRLRQVRDRTSAACLFRYKYCCINQELFLMSWVHRWLTISLSVDKDLGATECGLETLLSALESLESWNEEIESMRAR